MTMNIKPFVRASQLKRLRLVALTLAVFLGITLALGESFFIGNTKSAEPTQAELAAARREAEASMPRLPADIEDQLANARFPQLARYSSNSDPFVDKSGVTLAKASSVTPVAGGPSVRGSRAGLQPMSQPVPAMPDLTARVEEWRRSYRAAREANLPIPEKTRIYVLSELTPIGKFTTRGRMDVWFRLDAEQRTFSARIGTHFYDAELIGIGPDGPTFRMSNGTVRNVAWSQKEVIMTTRDQEASDTKEQQPKEAPATLPSVDSKTSQGSNGDGERISQSPINSAPKLPAKTETLVDITQESVVGQSKPYFAPTSRIPVTANLLVFEKGNSGEFLIQTPSAKFLPAAYREASNFTARSSGQFSIDRQFARYLAHARMPQTTREASLTTAINDSTTTAAPTPQPTPDAAPSPTPPAQEEEKEEPSANSPPVAAAPVAKEEQTVTAASRSPSPVAAAAAVMPDNRTGTAAVSPELPATEPQTTAPRKQNLSPLCDPNYKADLIDTEFTSATTLGNLVDKFNTEFGANIVLDNEVQDIPVRLTITNVPWTQFLRIILDLNDLGQVCMEGRLVGIAKRSKLSQMEDQRRRTEPVVQEIFHLRYLQPTAGGRINLAGQAQGGPAATIQSLEDAIRAILRASGDPRADVRRVPGRNELLVAGTREQIEKVRELIRRVDRPGYQVLIKALVYTANENRLRDVGSQLAAVVGNIGQTSLGGFTTLPNSSTGSGSGQTGQGGLNPGGIPGLAAGMRQPTNGLAASNAPATFGFTTLVGTAQFSYQLTLAQQRGVVNIQSRPFGIVTDGDTFDLVAGTQIPIVTSSIAGGTSVQTGQVQFIEASRIARITPQVADTEEGNPGFVTLNIQLENNAVDTSLGLFNGVPGVNRQSLQTVLRLRDGETAVIGGLAADTVSNAVSKVPGLGNVPVLGNLFKRKTNQENRDRLYFAITVQVIPQEAPIINVPTPSDAVTSPPPPPRAQKPSPFEPRR